MRSRRRAIRRRRLAAGVAVALLAGALVLAVIAGPGSSGDGGPAEAEGPRAPETLIVRVGPAGRTSVDLSSAVRGSAIDPARLSRLLDRELPRRWNLRHDGVRVTYRLDRSAAVRAVRRARGNTLTIRATPVASVIAAPVVAQRLRNNCESAALEILLATEGRRVPQLSLQAALPVSGTPDPVESSGVSVWGDPEQGYVGRPEGGGAAGGFGVYQRPIMDVADGFGVMLEDLSGGSVKEVVRTVREGRAVMVWIGLSDGPYGEWTSPDGNPVRVNFGEHTVVLNGITEDGRLRVVNPLEGTRELWTTDRFVAMWELLDRRAVAPSGKAQAGST